MKAQLFAATSPLAAFQYLLRIAMSREKWRKDAESKIGFMAIKKAHVFGKPVRKIFIKVPRKHRKWSGRKLQFCKCTLAATNSEVTYTHV